MINAIIYHGENTLVLELPRSIYDIHEKLMSIGYAGGPNQAKLTDNEGDALRVKLYGRIEMGNHLIRMLSEQNTLADANTLAFAVLNASNDIKLKLGEKIVKDQYGSIPEIVADIRQMTYDAGPIKRTFYCPLVGNIEDGYDDTFTVGSSFLRDYALAIEDAIEKDRRLDDQDMAQYFHEDSGLKNKLSSMVWGVEEYRGRLFGKIECSLKEEMTPAEEEILKDYISGQNSDGWGEHFEQCPIDTEDGDLYQHSAHHHLRCNPPDRVQLAKGVGHLLGSSLPVGGTGTHTVLTGHSGMASQKMFSDLPGMKVGDIFYLDILGQRLAYPEYKLIDIYADEGLSGTCLEKRDEQNRLIRDCKKGRIDRIIVKSVSRFARNTQELLAMIRALKEIGVSIYFEEQDIDTDKLNMEMIITFPGMAAQQESESISGNMRWSYKKRMESGDFNCCTPAYGYDQIDGQLVINQEEANVVRRIFDMYLRGMSMQAIASELASKEIPRKYGYQKWSYMTIRYILNNERYIGDAILNKTYIVDCLSKKVKVNNGERPKYYVENNHPAIIDSITFGRVQEEMARRNGKRKVKQVGTKTEQGRYSSKYALTDLLVCGECGTPYRRCTWTIKGAKKIVWRCIKRLDFGKKYCHNSPSIEESVLQRSIMNAIMSVAKQNRDVLNLLKVHIGMGMDGLQSEETSLDIQIRIAQIDTEFKTMLQAIASDTLDAFDEEKAAQLMSEKSELQRKLALLDKSKHSQEFAESRLDEICTILDGLENHPMTYDDQIVRQILERVVVESKEQIKVIFTGGMEVIQTME